MEKKTPPTQRHRLIRRISSTYNLIDRTSESYSSDTRVHFGADQNINNQGSKMERIRKTATTTTAKQHKTNNKKTRKTNKTNNNNNKQT